VNTLLAINNWPCSDETTTLQKLLSCPNVRNFFRN